MMVEIKGKIFETRLGCYHHCQNRTECCVKLAEDINKILEKNYKGKRKEVIVKLSYCSKWKCREIDFGD